MDEKVIFQLFKDIIIKQNQVFIEDIAKYFKRDPDYLKAKYIKPEYYLPILERSKKKTSYSNP